MALAGAGLGHLGRLWQQSKCWKGTTAEGPEPGRGLGGNGAVELDRGRMAGLVCHHPISPWGLPASGSGRRCYLFISPNPRSDRSPIGPLSLVLTRCPLPEA